jgi:hypothetical protein
LIVGWVAFVATARADEIDDKRIEKAVKESLPVDIYQRRLPMWDRDDGSGDLKGLPLPERDDPPYVPPDAGTGGGSGSESGSGGDTSGSGNEPDRGSGDGSSGSAGTGSAGTGSGSGSGSSVGSGSGLPTDDGLARRRGGKPRDPRAARLRPGGRGGADEYDENGVRITETDTSVTTILLWGGIILVGVLLLVVIGRQFMGYTAEVDPSKVEAAVDGTATPQAIAQVIELPRDEADDLAAQGRFAEAIHLLLLRTLHALATQNLVKVTPSMTTREVLARVPLIGDAREALAGLVGTVEVSWFGDDVPAMPDYQRCRDQFAVFAAAYKRARGAVAT